MRAAMSMLWVATRAATPRAATRPRNSSNTALEVAGSRLPVGSSASSRRGAVDEGAGHRDALLLAAGELRRLVVAPRGEA